MRHGIVRVNDVELVLAGDADDGVGEREQVLRLAEEWIRRRIDAFERESRQPGAPAERDLAADEMH